MAWCVQSHELQLSQGAAGVGTTVSWIPAHSALVTLCDRRLTSFFSQPPNTQPKHAGLPPAACALPAWGHDNSHPGPNICAATLLAPCHRCARPATRGRNRQGGRHGGCSMLMADGVCAAFIHLLARKACTPARTQPQRPSAPQISPNDFKNGLAVEIDGVPWKVGVQGWEPRVRRLPPPPSRFLRVDDGAAAWRDACPC